MEELAALARALTGEGLESKQIAVWQMGIRGALVYAALLVVVRLAKKLSLSRATAFDMILSVMIGSIASRAVTGNAPFWPALAGSAALVAAHWLVSLLALRAHWFGRLAKGRSRMLARDGAADGDAMAREHITADDLDEDLRAKGVGGIEQVAQARLERSGEVSVIRKQPRILETRVADGVQTVRIELSP